MKVNSKLNHSAAHLLAAAVLKLYPNTKIGFGPSIEEGFYYDFEFEHQLLEADLKKIEKQMKKMASGGYKFKKTIDAKVVGQPLKDELFEELRAKGEEVTYYEMINPSNQESIFTDLCAGPHIESTASIKHFKLLSLAGAYWRGDSNNKQLTRIYGTAWETAEELKSYLELLKERKERDHRKIGAELNIFSFNLLSGQGFPIWLEDGMKVKNAIKNYIRKMDIKYGFNEIETPPLGAKELYEKSGHWAHYKDDMFPVMKVENEDLVLRPMTCPHHFLVYNSKRHSYRELPIRYSEQAKLFRHEKSGALTGLERVRAMELTEGHIFARADQLVEEFKNSYNLIKETLDKFNIEFDYVSLSLRDKENKDKYYDDDALWTKAENDLRNVLKELKIEYKEVEGEAAFYGPKIDIQVKTVLGHEITLSTLQLDFLLPQRFEAYYIDENEQRQTPILIHRGLIGTYERFISILLEQTKGDLPFWCAPKQVTIIPVNNEFHLKFAKDLHQKLRDNFIHVNLDDRNERIAKKIREAQMSKTKFQIVVGDEEVNSQVLSVRKYGSEEVEKISIQDFTTKLKEMNKAQ